MAVLAASITTRNGKPLLSRQFVEMSKDRVMELLSNFQGLVANISSDHTYVEDEHVRYVYKPFDDYYLILMTNRQSNIIQDLSTLNLFSQTVNYYLNSFDENEIFENAFEILSSFDEIIVMGHKENLTIQQVNNYISMESHEERIQEIIEKNKESEANAERKRRAKEIARKEHERKMGMPPSVYDIATQQKFSASTDPNVANAYNSYYSNASSAAQQSYLHSHQQQETHMDNMGESRYSQINRGVGKGMQLSKGNKGPGMSSIRSSNAARPAYQEPEEEKPVNNGILITIKETVNAEISRDGAITSSELKGVMELRINKAELGHAKLTLTDNVDVTDKTLQFKTHPNIDKNTFLSSKVLGLRSSDKTFPCNDQSLGILRWRKVGKVDDKALIPLDVSTWVSPSEEAEGVFEVTVEFEVTSTYNKPLENIIFTIPVVTDNVSISEDNNDVNASIAGIDDEQGISIKVESIQPGSSGVFGFQIEAGFEDAMFPMNVRFQHKGENESGFTNINVASITASTDDAVELPFDILSTLKAEEYIIV
ncbi:hypothetical protein TPHA_0G03700 [Tetrapisispora phaffii CBS 4417]|uniref:Coatomer subunit delta n=1 Tax=Tetrapisispora phaffii (strain ATCC 24235 / CBS 4417 / NBRC 1672 / NRRL Y-8282 / UCD 70-5) TaxID=1071381 RepID=G8BWD2_TETPH|nr:hypothetical protein TPHA_0G03700 [Tetrapisispora phaffii CBS 4417]CCE64210.1 hypothetical protein TPHA_0G03700 [Tetrapisispora phaffii CBS 4417]